MKSSQKYRISIHRSVGHTAVTVDVPAELRDEAVSHTKELLAALPESTFQGDGVLISTVPQYGPRMDEA